MLSVCPKLSVLALWVLAGPLVGGGTETLSQARLAAIRAQQPARVETLTRALLSKQTELGLPAQTAFQVLTKGTDGRGQTHVRFQQTYKGVPVWKARAIAHLDAEGNSPEFQTALVKGISLDVSPAKSAGEAKAQVAAALGSRVTRELIPTQASLVVVPAASLKGLDIHRDTQTKRWVMDEALSSPVSLAQDSFVLAYHVKVNFREAEAGHRSLHYLVDAHSGTILQQWDAMRYDAPVGLGHSQYSGDVVLNTKYLNSTDGYVLSDTTRGSQPHPLYPFTGNETFWVNSAETIIDDFYDADNIFGDGANFTYTNLETSTNGQTAGVDAHYGAQVTWDMYKNVFGRDGIDDAGTSVASIVHEGFRWDNASWSTDDFTMYYGDGYSFKTLTCLDVAAHEMSHGVMAFTADLDYSGESGGLNEANSDIMGTMAEFYSKGNGFSTASSTIPSTGGNWTIGEQLSPEPLRYMYNPSLDGGWSYNFWFDGVENDDVHYSSGIANRFFYFLSQGTGASADYQSAYLSKGMAGIGNQKAANIWYTAMKDNVVSTASDYAAVRAATLTSATGLYGAASAEYQAVANAWGAVNVGAAYGAPDRIRVKLPTYAGNLDYFVPSSNASADRYLVLPMGITCQLKASVIGATDPSATWSVGSTGPFYVSAAELLPCSITSGGVITTGSYLNATAWVDQVKVTSVEDPQQFAATLVFQYNLDQDADGITDACDMAVIARNYGATTATGDITGNGRVNDNDVILFNLAFQNAFGK